MLSNEGLHSIVELYDRGDFQLVVARTGDAIQVHPHDGRLWQLSGTALANLARDTEAREALEQATMLLPLHPLAQLALATVYQRLGQTDLCCLILEHLGETVTKTSLLSGVAARLGALERYRSALLVCHRILRLNPEHHPAHYGVAHYLEKMGFPPQALIPHLALALDLAPHVITYRLSLAITQAHVGKTELARQLLAPVDLQTIDCPCWLQRLESFFAGLGDLPRMQACRERLALLNSEIPPS